MSEIAIKVENLGKQYKIGGEKASYRTLRESLMEGVKAPFQRAAGLLRGESYSAAGLDRTIWALKDVNLEINKGDVVGVIGPNGAGKSTLLKILSRITVPTEGRALIRGRVGSLLEVGTGFHPELTGRENIFLNGSILGMQKGEIEQKFEEIIDFSGVGKFIDTPVKHYSSGMRVRLAFSVAAYLDPEILLVDEVLSVGDAEFQKKSLGKMESVATEGRTVLFVSHNMTAVQSLCSSAIHINNGMIINKGPSDVVVSDYLKEKREAGKLVKSGVYQLLDRENHYGTGDLLVQSVKVIDSEGNPTNKVLMGNRIQVEISIKGLDKYPQAEIGIMIKNNQNQWITSINSGMSCRSVDLPRSRNEKAKLIIESIPLTPNTYWIDISVAHPGVERLDYVDRAAKLIVEESDVYGTGRQVSAYFGVVYLEGAWEIASNS